jgi:hypothetical protein
MVGLAPLAEIVPAEGLLGTTRNQSLSLFSYLLIGFDLRSHFRKLSSSHLRERDMNGK